MAKVTSKALNQTLKIGRYIGKIRGEEPGPSIIFIAGIHGNEPSGVFALHQVLQAIQTKQINVKGNIYALSGNLWALERGKRYHKQDLNRLWTDSRMKRIAENDLIESDEDTSQQLDIYKEIEHILKNDEGPFYFMDLHTTSSETAPFLTVNDSLLNRKFTEQYPCAMILGIEEYLSGPLLSYINELGFVSFGFEGGQHDSLASIENHEAFIYLSLVFSGLLSKTDIDFEHYFRKLHQASEKSVGIYEIYFRYQIREHERFSMKLGYENFQYIKRGEVLAESNGEDILAEHSSRIFMPLYQSQGDDGFFAIRPINRSILKLSEWFRKWKLDRLLPYLPGVQWADTKRDSLILNKRIAKYLAKELMHLMGYRTRLFDKNYILVKNREAASKHFQYKESDWYIKQFS